MTISMYHFFLNGYNIDLFQSILARLMGQYWLISFIFCYYCMCVCAMPTCLWLAYCLDGSSYKLKFIYCFKNLVRQIFIFPLQQAAGVKRLLFCGVGCQVQGMSYNMIWEFLFLSIFFVVTCTIVMQSNFLNCSIKIRGAALEFGKALCIRH